MGRNNEPPGPMRRLEARLGRPLRDVIHEYYFEQGLTLAEVGQRLAVDGSTVSRYMERLDLEPRLPGQRARLRVVA